MQTKRATPFQTLFPALIGLLLSATALAQQPATVNATLISDAETEAFYLEQAQLFAQENPDVALELSFYANSQYGNALQLLFQSGDAPDVFRTAGERATFYERGWLAPLDECLTDEVMARFPAGTFDQANSGLYIGGELYAIPFVSASWNVARVFYYNVDLLSDYGFEEPPQTWGEFRRIAATISEQGEGRIFGFAPAGQEIDDAVSGLASTAGDERSWSMYDGAISWTTGEPAAADSSYASAVELLRGLNAEGLFTPGWESWDNDQVFQQFALGRLGMFFGAAWMANQIRQLNPDINLGIAAPPVPDEGRASYGNVAGQNGYWAMSSRVVDRQAACKVLDFFSSAPFQRAYLEAFNTGVVLPQAYEGAELSEDTSRLLAVAEESTRTAPNIGSKHPDAVALYSAIVANTPQPTMSELFLLAITRNEDYLPMAQEYDAKLAQVITEQIAEIQATGSDITQDAFAFPDYNPLEDYQSGGEAAGE